MDLVRDDSGADWLESNYFSVVDNLGYCGQGVRGEVMDSGNLGSPPRPRPDRVSRVAYDAR